MPKLPILAPVALLLAACATNPAPVPGSITQGTCIEGPGQAYLGQAANAENGTAILAETQSSVIRWAPPNAMMTMEFSPHRVTVHYGADMKITKVSCG